MANRCGGVRASRPQAVNTEQRWRVSFGGVLTLAMIVGVVPQSALGVLGPLFVDEFGISRTQLGAAVSAFALVAGLGSPLAGYVTDRVAGRTLLVCLFSLGGLALMGMALSPVYAAFLGAVVCAGVAHALAIPSTNRLVAENIAPGTRGFIIGAKQSGVQLSHLLAGALFPFGATVLGWRWTLLASATLGLVGVVVALMLRLPAVDRDLHAVAPAVPVVRRYRHPKTVRVLAWAGLCMGAGIASFMTYLPLYSYESLGLSLALGGAAVSVVGFLGAVSRVFWSGLAERRNNIASALVSIAALSAGATVAVWLAAHTHVALLWIGVVIAGVSIAAWSAVSMLAAVEAARDKRVGRASGLVVLGFMTGMGIGPIAFGRAVDLTSTYNWGWLGATLSFTMAALISTRWRQADSPAKPLSGLSAGPLEEFGKDGYAGTPKDNAEPLASDLPSRYGDTSTTDDT